MLRLIYKVPLPCSHNLLFHSKLYCIQCSLLFSLFFFVCLLPSLLKSFLVFTCSLLRFCFIIVDFWFIFFFIFFSFYLDFRWFYCFYLTSYLFVWKNNRGILIFRSIWIYNFLNIFTRFLQFSLLVVFNLFFSLDGRIKNWFHLLCEPYLLGKIYTLARPLFDPVS